MSVTNTPRAVRRAGVRPSAWAALGLAAVLGTAPAGVASAQQPASSDAVTLRLGYFPNVTHAPAIVGVDTGIFQEALGDNVELDLQTFNAGTEAIEALFGESIDASFIGPNPAINGYAETEGEILRIVAGSTSGGASLVVNSDITEASQLEGTSLATPAIGGTQDVALRAWLADNGLETDIHGGGDVEIINQANGDTLTSFQEGESAGAWVPEPWATRLVLEGEGHVLVNEADLWPDGQFVTTHLIVATEFLDEHPDVVKNLIAGLVTSIETINADPAAAQTVVNDGIEAITDNRLADETIGGAFQNLTFTYDPIASSLQESADDAATVGLLEPVDLASPGIYDLTLLNEVLTEVGLEPVAGVEGTTED